MNLNAAICIEFIIYQRFLSVFAFSYFWPAATDKKFVERSNSKEITARCKVLYQT